MSHAAVLVALSPDDVKRAGGDVKEAVAYQMEPFNENGEWFKDGSRWDWWVIGGRFTDRLDAERYDPSSDPANKQTCWLCNGTGKRDDALGRQERQRDPSYGCNGCGGTGMETKHPSEFVDRGNVARRGALTEDGLLAARRKRFEKYWDEYQTELRGGNKSAAFVYGIKEGDVDKETYVASRTKHFSTPVFLKDREWHEHVRMGWFGGTVKTECELKAAEKGEEFVGRCIHQTEDGSAKIIDWTGPKDSDEKWDALFWARFLRNLPDDYLLVVVDYHV